jgi:Holliday junction resolvase
LNKYLDGARPVKGGRSSRDKGNRVERAIVKALQEGGFAAERVPLSGSARGSRFGGYDISIPILGLDRRFEVKARRNDFVRLYGWLEGNYGLIVKADRKDPLIVIRMTDAIEVALAADKNRSSQHSTRAAK